MEDIISQIPAWIFIAFGVFLIALEMVTTMFILIFFGIAFSLVGVVSFFIVMSGEIQILTAMLIGGLLTFFLRKYFLKLVQSKGLPLETLATGETGVLSVHNGELRVSYKGTTWAIRAEDKANFTNDEIVVVKELKNNIAIIAKQ